MAEKPKPPPPKASPSPDYDEKVHLEKLDTGSWKFEDVVHELKRQARRRLRRWVTAGTLTATGLGSGGLGMFRCDSEQKRAERAEERAKKSEALERRLKTIEQDLTKCCSWVPPPP